MNPVTVIAESFVSLNKNKVRTTLSMLGIVIGVASVIAMVAVGEGAQRKVEREIASIGDDWLMIMYWGMQTSGVRKQGGIPRTMTREDVAVIERECPAVRAATPTNRISSQAISSYGNYQTSAQGAYPNFFDIRRWDVTAGRLFNSEDMALTNKVCVIGTTAAKELFGAVSPVGETVRVNRVAFEVIGLLESKGVVEGRDYDDCLLFPYTSFERLIAGNETSGSVYAAAKPGMPLAVAKEQIRQALRRKHRVSDEADDPFRIWDRAQTAQATAEATSTFNRLLMTIAAISLLVGGVGIMNIMLVSVTERTREIGLRMAIGANSSHILGQFLCEAIVLCAVGGAVGFVGGWGLARYMAITYGWEIEVAYWMVGAAIGFATAVGLFFGFYPAWRASRLDPIEALRYE